MRQSGQIVYTTRAKSDSTDMESLNMKVPCCDAIWSNLSLAHRIFMAVLLTTHVHTACTLHAMQPYLIKLKTSGKGRIHDGQEAGSHHFGCSVDWHLAACCARRQEQQATCAHHH